MKAIISGCTTLLAASSVWAGAGAQRETEPQVISLTAGMVIDRSVTIHPGRCVRDDCVALAVLNRNRFRVAGEAVLEPFGLEAVSAPTFDGDETAIRLWQNATQDPNWAYPKHIGAAGAGAGGARHEEPRLLHCRQHLPRPQNGPADHRYRPRDGSAQRS